MFDCNKALDSFSKLKEIVLKKGGILTARGLKGSMSNKLLYIPKISLSLSLSLSHIDRHPVTFI